MMTEKAQIDVIIPYHAKDSETIEMCIRGCKKNLPEMRKLYLVTAEKAFRYDGVELIDENSLFSVFFSSI